jgi:D-glycero-beta-D-manno-heptose 1-phosphate adenylyltransferase
VITCSSIAELSGLVNNWKTAGEKIVFTNGVYDILHLGHVDYLEKAKALGTKLVVAINADSSVKKLNKGPERPINPENARATIIAALRCVDATIIFAEDSPLNLITTLMPDVLVKGGDYDVQEKNAQSKTYIVGSKEVIEYGGEVKVIPLVQGFSTTNIVRKLQP